MGQRDPKCLLIRGAMAVVNWAVQSGETTDSWLDREAPVVTRSRDCGQGDPSAATWDRELTCISYDLI